MTAPLAIAKFGSFSDNLQFLRGMGANPRYVASLVPSSPALARRIAAQVDPRSDGTVLELGPGTGAVTAALLERGVNPDRLILVERDSEFVQLLRKRFPGVRVRLGNALDIERHLSGRSEQVGAIVSGLPLRNLRAAVRERLVEDCLSKLKHGASLIQVSFGWRPPVRGGKKWRVHSAGVVIHNLPPATVWVYSRHAASSDSARTRRNLRQMSSSTPQGTNVTK
jgi:phosphatidylethanolamine/phosphatidyl-N-methylethanolamine N-methyltransferase